MKPNTRQTVTKLLMVAVATMTMATPANSAAVEQLDAGDDPQVAGPLELQTKDCKQQQETFEGQTVAAGKTCLRIYTYDPAAEADATSNYGIVWLQSTLNSSRGWCGAVVRSDVDLPTDITVLSKAPKSMEVNRKKEYETSLSTTASGNGGEASIRQNQVLYPNVVRTKVIEDDNIFRLRWAGFRDEKLAFASGAEISWAADDAPGGIQFRLNYEIKRGDC